MSVAQVNMGERQDNGEWARYLPAISGFYSTHLGKDASDPEFIPKDRVPEKFEHGIQGLNFLDPVNSYYHYPYGLFSAGHAERNLAKCDNKEPMIHKRDRNKTVIVGDSGGYQVATGVIKLDWATVRGPEGDKLREEILRYLEHTADWSMTLDVPAFAATPPLNKKTGLKTFNDALDITLVNLHYFMKNRIPGATKFLNVLSGSDPRNSKEWYEEVKHFSDKNIVELMGYSKDRTLEGYAFAGVNMRNMACVLERILNLRDDNLLHDKDWIHFLGVGRMDWACYLTSIERQLRKRFNKNLHISFDAASPFVAAGGYGLSYDYIHFSADRTTYSMSKGIDDKSLKGTKYGMVYQGPIMDRLTTGDMCPKGPTDTNKNGKIGKTSWDTTTYALVMAHNVYNHIQAVQEINRLADIDYATRGPLDFELWYHNRKGKSKKRNFNQFLPNSILFFNDFVERLFDPENEDPYQMLKDNYEFLHTLGFGDKKVVTEHGELFEQINVTDEGSVVPDIDVMATMDPDIMTHIIENE